MRAELKALASTIGMILGACVEAPSTGLPSGEPSRATVEAGSEQVGPNDYIVVLKDTERDVGATSSRLATLAGTTVKVTWEHALKGFLADVSPGALERLRSDPAVAFVERDAIATLDSDVGAQVVQPVPNNWGLDRIDQRLLPLNGTYRYLRTGGPPGVVIHAYVMDSGINPAHTEFIGSLGAGISFVPGVPSLIDCNGHGTFMSSVLGGTVNGVAKGVIIHPVRVFGCSGTAPFSRIITAVNWVQLHDIGPAVTLMPFGGPFNGAVNAAVNTLVLSGNSVTVNAGSSGGNACNFSPASAVHAITVAATGTGGGIPPTFPDALSPFSATGPCVDLYAPGFNIRGAFWTSPVATTIWSGTAGASAHAAGAAALLRDKFPLLSALAVRNSLVLNGTLVPGLPGRLLYMGYIG
ncbi:MAG: S8 family serine peptidase [Gemmatimonadaceae bacterium]